MKYFRVLVAAVSVAAIAAPVATSARTLSISSSLRLGPGSLPPSRFPLSPPLASVPGIFKSRLQNHPLEGLPIRLGKPPVRSNGAR